MDDEQDTIDSMLHALERGWRRIWLGILRALLRPGRRPRATLEWRTQPCRVLFLRPDRMGDAILTTGVLRAIANVSPHLRLDVLASPRNAAILERVDGVSRVLIFDKKRLVGAPRLLREMRAARYDAVIDCMVTASSITTILLMLASGARHRIGIAGRGADEALTTMLPPTPGGEHLVDLLGAFAGFFGASTSPAELRPHLHLGQSTLDAAESTWIRSFAEQGPRLLVNVSAGREARLWPEHRFVAAIRHLRESYDRAGVIVIGDPSDGARAHRIAGGSGAVAVPTPRFEDVMGLVATASFVFTPDTSVAHLASAFTTPAVVMYAEGTAARWGLYHTPGASLESVGPTLETLELEDVLPALDRVVRPLVAGVA
jgi:ADP-heptose:LPS heptosyltransferase